MCVGIKCKELSEKDDMSFFMLVVCVCVCINVHRGVLAAFVCFVLSCYFEPLL